jgi:hypothetical protein
MPRPKEVDAAITAHMVWKTKLYSAITTGQTTLQVESVRKDNACQLGQWLFGTPSVRSSPHFGKIQNLHWKFHQEAASVLELATSGRRDEARTAMGDAGSFQAISRALINALTAWESDP